MPKTPPDGYQRVIPYLAYADPDAALSFLTRAFGFTERFRMPGPDGSIMHAEIEIDGNVVMLASAFESMGFVGADQFEKRYAFTMVYVDDIDAHCATAMEHGATISEEPKTQFYGDRTYRAIDPQGHHWYFATRVKDVPLEELSGPPPGECE